MAEPLAIWGAVTGTIGAAVAVRREIISRKQRLAIRLGINLNISRKEPGKVTHAWAFVNFWNSGARPLAVERVGFRYYVNDDTTGDPERRANIHLESPIELPVDGPSVRVSTPLGPMVRAGIDPFSPIEAWAMTTGDKEWTGPSEPLIQVLPPATTPDRFLSDLEELVKAAETPPDLLAPLVALTREEPFLPED